MTGYRVYLFLFTIPLLFAGCSHHAAETARSLTKVTPQRGDATTQTVLPDWYQNPPAATSQMLYGVGKGANLPEAKAEAVRKLLETLSVEISETLQSGMRRKRGIYRYLDPGSAKAVDLSLGGVPLSSYGLLESEKLPDGSSIVLVGIERKRFAEPLKRVVLRRLVEIEERWHASGEESTLQRYRIAVESFEKMKRLLPHYLAAHAISPFSRPIVSRIEEGTPYFERIGERLKKRLGFCIEPAVTPALRLFSDAVETALKEKRIALLESERAGRNTLCISVKGRILHEKSAGSHTIRAAIELILHKRSGDPILVQHYSVEGVSDKSGPDALQKAAEGLRREVRQRFLHKV